MAKGLATVINFCTNDYGFFDKCVEEVRKFSDYILIPVCDHFFNGIPENRELLNDIYCRYPDLHFIEYAFLSNKLYGKFLDLTPDHPDFRVHWFGTSRYLAYLYLPEKIEYALFLDVDEIPDGKRMSKWLEEFPYKDYEALRFYCYYYFRSAHLQAKTWTENAILAKKSALHRRVFFNNCDRVGTFSLIEGKKLGGITGSDKKPLMHHYCWVKTKEECLKKSATHSGLWIENLENRIQKEFSGEFTGEDFDLSFQYRKIRKPFFDPLSFQANPPQTKKGPFPHVKYISEHEAFKRELELEFQMEDLS